MRGGTIRAQLSGRLASRECIGSDCVEVAHLDGGLVGVRVAGTASARRYPELRPHRSGHSGRWRDVTGAADSPCPRGDLPAARGSEFRNRIGAARAFGTARHAPSDGDADRGCALAVAGRDGHSEHLHRCGHHCRLLRLPADGLGPAVRGDRGRHPARNRLCRADSQTGAQYLSRGAGERGCAVAVVPGGDARHQRVEAASWSAPRFHGAASARFGRDAACAEYRCRIQILGGTGIRTGVTARHHGADPVRTGHTARTVARCDGRLCPGDDVPGNADAEFHAPHSGSAAR